MQLSEKKTINLLVTLNHHYLEPLKIMLYSFGEHHRDCVTELYIVHSSLTAQDFGELAKEIADFQIHIHNIKITERYFKDGGGGTLPISRPGRFDSKEYAVVLYNGFMRKLYSWGRTSAWNP